MASKKLDLGSNDLISSLPDPLIGHILSFLSTKDAALTPVLAKRWRYLLAFVPILDLDNFICDQAYMSRRKWSRLRSSFEVFVNRIMTLQGNASLNKVSLRYEFHSDPFHVNGWILNVLERGVIDLDVYIYNNDEYFLPPKVFVTKTLVKLKLEGAYKKFIIDVEEVCLPKLKTLYLHDVAFDETGSAFAKLISGCPVLEELVMIDVRCHIGESFSVSKPTLKKLTVRGDYYGNYPKSVLFDTPNLLYLQYSDTIAVEYPKVSFDSLVEASLGLRNTSNGNGNATDFLMGLCNVRILYLTSGTIKVLNYHWKAIPVFVNLFHLTIETNQALGWESLPELLENCPNLETLVFERLQYKDSYQCSDEEYCFEDTSKCMDDDESNCVCKPWDGTPVCISASPVKMLKVLKFGEFFGGNDDMVKQIKIIEYFLKTMPNLEEVILYYDTPINVDVKIVSTQLQWLEKVASTKCKIQVISDNISFSSTVYSSSSANELVFFKNVFPV